MAITLSNSTNNTNTSQRSNISLTNNTTNTTITNTSQRSTISLTKGANLSLTKEAPGLKNLLVGLGWDVNGYDGGDDFDLDVSVFMLGADGKVPSNDEFIFFNQKVHKSGAVEHTGDNRTGAGDGDDETIKIDLSKMPSNIEKIAFTVTIYDAINRRQTFGQVENSYIRILNEENNEEIVRYDLVEDFSIENAMVVGELYRHNGEWKFKAVGAGFANNLEGLTNKYGVILG